MEAVEEFMSGFNDYVEKGDARTLSIYLDRESRKCFQNISENEIDNILLTVFNSENGLLRFLENTLKNAYLNKKFSSAATQAFHLLQFIIKSFTRRCEPYIPDTMKICELGIVTKLHVYVQKAACNTVIEITKYFNVHDIHMDEMVRSLISKLQISDIKERVEIFRLIGIVARHFIEVPEMKRYYNDAFLQLRSDFNKKYNPSSEQKTSEIGNYLEVFTNILSISIGELEDPEFLQQIYNCVYRLSVTNKNVTYKTMRSAVNLLSNNMNLFKNFISENYQYWYNLFLTLTKHQNQDNVNCGNQAMKAFYEIIGSILKESKSSKNKAIFVFFKDVCLEKLLNDQIDADELNLILHGCSQLVESSKNYIHYFDVKDMYLLISRRLIPLYSSENTEQINLDSIRAYQETLSGMICHMPNVSLNEVTILIKSNSLLIKRFPDLPATKQESTITSLIKTIVNVGSLNTNLSDEFLYRIINDGILWSCSHTLLIDAKLQQELNETSTPTNYKNYLPLWKGLLQRRRYEKIHGLDNLPRVANKLVSICIIFLRKLNLNTEQKKDTVLCDFAMSQTAVNEADFRIFINLTDLYVDIFKQTEVSLLVTVLDEFLYNLIRLSYKYPLISGFYKLIHAVLKTSHTSREENEQMRTIIKRYLTNILKLMSTFSNELLLSSLYLVLEAPVIYIQNELNNMVAAFKTAFNIGLTNLELAFTAFDCLERSTYNVKDKDTLTEFLQKVLPSLELYLQSRESSSGLRQDILKSERKTIKWATFIRDNKKLEDLQTKILLFLGSLDSMTVLNFIHERALDTGATWNKKDLIKYTLPYPNVQVDIYFDKILPRLTTLAESSGDRHTKVAACEVLHAITTFIIGKTAQTLSELDRFNILCKSLFPTLLRLGCDSDEVTRQLFHPLMLQLIHWLSHEATFSDAKSYLLDSIFESLCNESNSSLRDFSGMCLATFLEWSMKQMYENYVRANITKDITNVIIRKLYNYALHPATNKRVAAAVAFNYLYKVLREYDDVISKYWLEMLYCFVKSLDGCNNPLIDTAIDYIERVIKLQTFILNNTDPSRRKPHEFIEGTLVGAAYWLFAQCGSLDCSCRKKCMQLYIKISQYAWDDDPEGNLLEQFIEKHEIDVLNNTILKGLNSKMKDTISVEYLSPLLRSFDCYTWIIQEKLLDLKYLFTEINPRKDEIFNSIKDFIYLLNNISNEDNYKDNISMMSEHSQILLCKTITAMFRFIHILLELNDFNIPNFSLNTDLFELLSLCIMNPERLKFDAANVEIIEILPTCLENLILLLTRKMEDEGKVDEKQQFQSCIRNYVNKHLQYVEVINLDINENEGFKQYVRGLIILHRCNILVSLYGDTFTNMENKLQQIFYCLQKEQTGKIVCTDLRSVTMEYLSNLIEFILTNYTTSLTTKLIKLISNDTLLYESETKRTMHGEYFLNIFNDQIFKYFLKDVNTSVSTLFSELTENPSCLLNTIRRFLIFVQRYKKDYSDSTEVLADTILSNFSIFETIVGSARDRKEFLLNICGICVRLKREITNISSKYVDIYQWILNEIAGPYDIDYKTLLFEEVLLCITDTTTERKPELTAILSKLRSNRTELDNNPENIKILQIKHCFHTLTNLLPVTKSVAVYESIILFAAGVCHHVWNQTIDKYIKQYFSCIPSSNALMSLEIEYKVFMAYDKVEKERFDILRRFLLPSFEYCSTSVIEQFFENYIKDICRIIDQGFVGTDLDIKQHIISKIGCFELVGIMFTKVSMEKITGTDSAITKQIITDIKTGKELMRHFHSAAVNVRALKTTNHEHKNLMRLLQCSAYNCSITIVSLSDQEKFYCVLFHEKDKNQLIWKNIIDCEKSYQLRQTVNTYTKNKKKLVNIRKTVKDTQNVGSPNNNYSYIYKYDLATSTLNEDIHLYDFNNATILSKSDANKSESMSLVFESDDFNDHECMSSIVGVLSHMIEKNICASHESDISIVPDWLKCFRNSMRAADHENVRLFLLKIILNAEQVFKPYAKFLLSTIMKILSDLLEKHPLNYIITDVLLMIINWNTIAIPVEDIDKHYAQKLLETIVSKITEEQSSDMKGYIYRYNIQIMRTMIEVWHSCLKVPDDFNKNSTLVTVSLILTCLIYMTEQLFNRDDVLKILLKPLANWEDDEEIVLQSCEALGLILNYIKENDEYTDKKTKILTKIGAMFSQMNKKVNSRMVKCIYALCKNYHEATVGFFHFVGTNISHLDLASKKCAMEILLLHIKNVNEEKLMEDLIYFNAILKSKIEPCEEASLRVIHCLAMRLSATNLLSLINIIPSYAKNKYVEYREMMYNILITVYDRFSKDISDDEDPKKLVSLSRQLLLSGLVDPATEIQEKLLKFWTENTDLPNNTENRLLDVLKIYSPEVENSFLIFVALTMLNLASKSPDYEKKMFEPLENCDYRDYNITVLWRTKTVCSMAPLFAPSLASQISEVYTQTSNFTNETSDLSWIVSTYGRKKSQVQKTQESKFSNFTETTMPSTSKNLKTESVSESSKIIQPAHYKRSKRFIFSNLSDKRQHIRDTEIRKNIERAEMIKEEGTRQRSDVKLNRLYRIGDFPDIGISHSDIIKPLQELIKKDQLICKDLTVSIICSIIKLITGVQRSNTFAESLSLILTNILKDCQSNNPMVATILEVIISSDVIQYYPDSVSKIAKATCLNSLGILLLEEYLNREPDEFLPPTKKAKRNVAVESKWDKWIQLADLYESVNEVDVVLSIFQKEECNEKLRESSLAQAARNWMTAARSYEEAYEMEESEEIKEHCLKGLFECYSQLSFWPEIDKRVQIELQKKELNDIRRHPWKDLLLSWSLESFVQTSLTNHNTETSMVVDVDTISTIDSWLSDQDFKQYLKCTFGEEIAMLFFLEYEAKEMSAIDFLNSTLNEIRKQWIVLNPLSTQLRIRTIEKLCTMNEINMYVKTLKNSSLKAGVRNLLNFWIDKVGIVQDNLLLQDKLMSYRTFFASSLKDKMYQGVQTDISEAEEDLITEMQNECIIQNFKLIDTAICQKNKYIAKKCLIELKPRETPSYPNFKYHFYLYGARREFISAELESNPLKKISSYKSSWKHSQKHLHKLLLEDDLDLELEIKFRQNISAITAAFVQLNDKNPNYAELIKDDLVSRDIESETSDLNDLKDKLISYGLNQLKICCSKDTKEKGKCYFALSKYCYENISNNVTNPILIKELMRSTLKAMSYGLSEAAHYFPCLLKSEYLNDDELKHIFEEECKEIQPWRFLQWQAQLFSNIGTDIAPLVIPIIERIVKKYPNAVIYTFYLAADTYDVLKNDERTYKIRKLIYDNPDIEHFLKAMEYVVQPELYLRYYIVEFIQNLSKGKSTAIDILMKQVYSKISGGPRPGNIYSKLTKYKRIITQLENKNVDDIKKECQKIVDDLKKTMDEWQDKARLEQYSPWLFEYTGNSLEIPGQYNNLNREPLTQYHTKIAKMGYTVKVMRSLRRPIQITMIGNDAKEYKFLVKFGEDLRLDQRLQQLFAIMNGTLLNNVSCKQRRLSIDTYNVTPLSKSLGLITWVEKTRPLKDLIFFTLSQKEREKVVSISESYEAWIQSAAPRMREHEQYKRATEKYSAVEVVTKMTEFINAMEWSALRRSFVTLSASLESFVSMRQNFITSYATMCVAHWLLGIGDRHLDNTMIIIHSGRCLGVDFGLTFDTGVDMPIPELMPFRLTPQILGLFKPFTENDLFGATMTHVLYALRNEKSRILASLDGFLHETLDWTKNINKTFREEEEEEKEDKAEAKWVPNKKLNMIRKKFDGIKPSLITLEQLKEQHYDEYFPRYEIIINGEDEVDGNKRLRVKMSNFYLTPGEQVQCLLDQATDLNILGRTYVKWMPWL